MKIHSTKSAALAAEIVAAEPMDGSHDHNVGSQFDMIMPRWLCPSVVGYVLPPTISHVTASLHTTAWKTPTQPRHSPAFSAPRSWHRRRAASTSQIASQLADTPFSMVMMALPMRSRTLLLKKA